MKKSLKTFIVILGIMMLTLVTDVTAQTPDFRSADMTAITQVNNITYLATIGSDARVTLIDHNTNTETFDVIPNFNVNPSNTNVYKNLIAATADGNYCIGGISKTEGTMSTSVQFNVNGNFDDSKRISINANGIGGIIAIKSFGSDFIITFGLEYGFSIAIADNFTSPIASYNTTIGGLVQFVNIKVSSDGTNPHVVGCFNDISDNSLLDNRNFILEWGYHYVQKFHTNDSTLFFEMDTLGNNISHYSVSGLADIDRNPATGDIYISHNIYQNSYIEKFDSNMNLLATSKIFHAAFSKIQFTTLGQVKVSTQNHYEQINGSIVFDQDLDPIYSRGATYMDRAEYWGSNASMENQIVQNAPDGLSSYVAFTHTGNPYVSATGLEVAVNGVDIPDAGSGKQTVLYTQNESPTNPQLQIASNPDVHLVHYNSKLDSFGAVVQGDSNEIVIVYKPAIDLTTTLGPVDVTLFDGSAGTNTNPRAGMTTIELNHLHSYGYGIVDTNDLGQYSTLVQMYNHTDNMPFYLNNVERKWYTIHFKTAADMDGDLIADALDNCINTPNPNQLDTDNDSIGNVCDDDDDNDMVLDVNDAFPLDSTEWLDNDNDNIGDNADTDDDNDGYDDTIELAEGADPLDENSTPADYDGDFIPNSTDTDDDNDGYEDIVELAEGTDPLDENSTPADYDGDFIPDSTDDDIDGDGVANAEDAFPYDETETEDFDQDNIGNNADPDDDNDGYNDDVDAFPLDGTKWEMETSIESLEAKGIKLFPNPVKDVLSIVSDVDISSLFILNSLGQVVKLNTENADEISVSELSSGIYFVKISIENQVLVSRFVKE